MPAGQLIINGYDAYTTWGVSLEDGALSAFAAFYPTKEPVVNKNITAEGASVVYAGGHRDERTISVPMHMVANSGFTTKYSGFYNAIKTGPLTIQTPVGTYTMYYRSCSEFTYYNGLAKFVLNLYEP